LTFLGVLWKDVLDEVSFLLKCFKSLPDSWPCGSRARLSGEGCGFGRVHQVGRYRVLGIAETQKKTIKYLWDLWEILACFKIFLYLVEIF
jgi:hypothetical protein